jgi:hypothetical protein
MQRSSPSRTPPFIALEAEATPRLSNFFSSSTELTSVHVLRAQICVVGKLTMPRALQMVGATSRSI